MQSRIFWISPFRAALIVGVISFLLSYPIIGIMWVFNQFATKPGSLNWAVLTILPLLISFCAAVFAGLGALSYNLVAKLGLCVTVRIEPSPSLNSDVSPTGGAPVADTLDARANATE